jgi:hypothetical protein
MKKSIFYKLILFILLPKFLVAQDGYPKPTKTNKSLFYIQRNHNKNTIMYDAKFDENGMLNKECPVDAYWIRYEEKGQRLNLRKLEKWMVFGINCEKTIRDGYDYKVNLSASKKISLYLRQVELFKAEIHIELKGEMFKLEHIYARLFEGSWLPKPKYAEIFGYNLSDGKPFYKKINPKDIK